jgi:hypothetical protein
MRTPRYYDDEHQYMKPGAPRYRLTEPAYIDDQLLEAGREINFEGIPGYHMEPLDDAAREMKAKYPSQYVDPITSLQTVGVAPDPKDAALVDMMASALAKALAPQTAPARK